MLARKPEAPRQHMVQLQSGIGMKGGPDNPLGARAMYLWSGNKDTLYRIHGTNEPWTIGTNVSSGCIRLTNEDIVDLYNRDANRRESHRVRDRQTGRRWAIGPASSTGDSSDPLGRNFCGGTESQARGSSCGFFGNAMMPLCSRPFSSSITLSGTRAGRSPSMIWPMTPGAKRAVCTGAPNRPRCAIHPSRNGSLAPSPAFCDRKFEIVTPTSRMPLGGGKTDRIRPRATSCSLSLVSMLVSIDRLRVDI